MTDPVSRVYLDHAATTPMVPAAVEAMTAELTRVGNASSLHGSGRAARRVVEESREVIAACVGAKPAEVIFTSGGTEADNLALKGAFWSARDKDPTRTGLVSTTIEHHAVLDTLGWLAQAEGADVTLASVDVIGRVDLWHLAELVGPTTAMVSVMWGNNEVGTLQPVVEAADLARERGALSHSDAVQAVGHVPVNFAASGLDTMTFTAHKLGGPYGVGALLARREVQLISVQHGGGQERDVRSGTLDVAAIAGFAAAVQVAVDQQARAHKMVNAMRNILVTTVPAYCRDVRLNGSQKPGTSLPGIVNFSFSGCEADTLLMLLDQVGIDCSTGSACSAGLSQPSHVLMAMGLTEREARSSLRFSLNQTTTLGDIQFLLQELPEAVYRARAAGSYAD